MLENPAGYRKSSDDYGVTIAVPINYVDRLKPLMHKAGKVFMVYLVQVASAEQAEYLLKQSDGDPAPQVGTPEQELVEGRFVDVATLADLFGMTERNVQLQAEKGLLIRSVRGQYDTLASCGTLWKALQEQNSGKNDAYNEARTKGIQLKTKERELGYHERAGNLVNAAAVRSVIEKAKAAEKQQVLFMPKQLAPRLEGDPAVNEAVLEEWAYSFLKGQTEINITTDVAPAPDVDKMPELKKQSVSRKARKARKGKR